MKIKNLKAKIAYLMAVGVSIFALFFFITCSWIGYDIKKQCYSAKQQYDGECVPALISLLQDENQPFRARNGAIWALGQLGDEQALPVLQEFYTGNIPDREPLDETISQYELKKAIALLEGGTNISAWVWRNFWRE